MDINEQIPKEKKLDNSFAVANDGYLFIKNRVYNYHSDLFQTRLFTKKAICMSGKEAAKIFYNPELFQRLGATPKHVQKTLFGEKAIQSMDGKAHVVRKHLFLSLTAPEKQKHLAGLVIHEWLTLSREWDMMENISLFDASKSVLCSAACRWAGIPLKETEVTRRADDFSAMVDAFGAVGPRYWKGKSARTRAEGWIKEIIENVRSGKFKPEDGSALQKVCYHEELNGSLLNAQMAAVELINILRPIVAISTFIVFAALALQEHPECRVKLQSDTGNYSEMFVQEVRRYYPFTPFIGAKARKDFVWDECYFKKGTLVLLDIYGTDHDSRIWDHPNQFQPERFQNWKGGPFDFMPQGGGDPAKGHRCPGEGVTIEVMKASINFLVNQIEYDVPAQDLSYSLGRLPTLPKSGFIISNFRYKK